MTLSLSLLDAADQPPTNTYFDSLQYLALSLDSERAAYQPRILIQR